MEIVTPAVARTRAPIPLSEKVAFQESAVHALTKLSSMHIDEHWLVPVASEAENCVETCKVGSKAPRNIDVYGVTSRSIDEA